MSHPLAPLLSPRSIAIVGASDRPDTNGRAMFDMCRIDGYAGRVYPINPRLARIDDLPCYASLSDLPEVPDHVVIGVASHLVEAVLDEATALCIQAGTIFASCFLEEETSPRLRTRIAEKCRASGMALCGANCMGFFNPVLGLRVASMPSPGGLRRGGIAWIAQSGSALGALAHNDRRLGFSFCVSTGMELVTTAADYMDWALSLAETRVIGLFLETVRDPEGFVAALERAVAQRVPVVVLKVGRTEASAEMAMSHTGALAGNDAAFEALFRRYGVIRVDDLDEMAATLALFETGRPLGPGGFGSMHDSGGERELVTDLAEDIGLEFPQLAPETSAAMSEHLELGLTPENPLDAFGTNRDIEARYTALMGAMMDDPGIAVGYFMANPRDGYPYAEKYCAALHKVARKTQKPLALVSNYAMTQEVALAGHLADAGVPLLRGTRNALRAARHLLDYRDFTPNQPAMPELQAVPAAWTESLSAEQQLSEAAALDLLCRFGIPTPKLARIKSRAELADALRALSFPIVLKTAEDHAHKSELGGVILDITDPPAAVAAYADLSARLGPRVLAMEMAGRGPEIALGAFWDAGFGTVVLLSAGGILIEILNDKVAALAPFDATEAKRLLETLRLYPLLTGARGQDPVDIDALAVTIARFSTFAAALGPRLAEMDINPLICTPDGPVAVDCLLRTATAP